MATRPDPSWILKDPGSFASIHVKLPPGTLVNCESDAVVSFSQGVEVRGVMQGGLIGALARAFFTQESFFTTQVENSNPSGVADVMMAPSESGGIVLHKLSSVGRREMMGTGCDVGGDLLLTSGSYVASDSNVKITSEVQTRIGNSLMSGTGFFLLRASGRGYVACGAYGSVHKYVLTPGEVRAVDNGHLVAWSASMNYWVGLASGGRGTGRRLMNSVTSGEGLMCYFEGPGTVYLQSHKPDVPTSAGGQIRRPRRPPSAVSCFSSIMFLIMFVMFLGAVVLFTAQFNELVNTEFSDGDGYEYKARKSRRRQNFGYDRDEEEHRGYGQGEF
jgi:uncharacterized protein (TIGR00266 family)